MYAEQQYLDLLQKIMDTGVDRMDRTGVGTRSIFGHQIRFNLQDGFPLLTTKKVFIRGIIHELLWFISGETNIRPLVQNDVKIWNEWAFAKYLQKKYNLTLNIIPQNFSVAAFLSNKEALQQGYFIAEPHHIVQAGGKMPRFLSTWDAGFRAYAVLVTNRKFARENPETLKAFTQLVMLFLDLLLRMLPVPKVSFALKKLQA